MDSARRRLLKSASGPPNRLSREPGRTLPFRRTYQDSKPRRATGSGKVPCRHGVPETGPEAEQDEKNSYSGAKGQVPA